MDYQNHYNRLIERANTRTVEGYTEGHHVIPKCLGGTDDLSNIVQLTPEEHYVAHQLLVKINPDNFGLIKAAHMMSVHNTNVRIGNKKFGWLRRAYSNAQRDLYANKDNHPRGMKGKRHSQEHRDLLLSYAIKNGAARATAVYQWNKQGELVKRHSSLTEAAKEVKSSPSNIKACCEGTFKQAKTSLWSYTEVCPEIPKELYSGRRRVHTCNGEFSSVSAAVEHYGFTSSKQVRHRCLSEKFTDWYYIG